MFRRKIKSTEYMRGLLYAEELYQKGWTIDDLWEYLNKMVFGNSYDRFDCGFRDFLHVLKLRKLKDAT